MDTREKLPMFKQAIVRKMDTGDYTTEKLEGIFHIERKSGEDLYGTIIQGHERFKREILRAAEAGTKLVVYVECSREDFIMKRFKQGYKRKMKPGILSKIIDTMSERYDLQFEWCHGRENMRLRMKERFEEEEAKLNE
jgi:ERCC4-type nuclease